MTDIIFGDQYFYLGDNVANQALTKENQDLKEKLTLLEQKIDELLNKKYFEPTMQNKKKK